MNTWRRYIAGVRALFTAMVFVWEATSRGGDAANTLVQVALNDLIMRSLFAPIVVFLLGVSKHSGALDTVILFSGLALYVIPLGAGYLTSSGGYQTARHDWFQ